MGLLKVFLNDWAGELGKAGRLTGFPHDNYRISPNMCTRRISGNNVTNTLANRYFCIGPYTDRLTTGQHQNGTLDCLLSSIFL